MKSTSKVILVRSNRKISKAGMRSEKNEIDDVRQICQDREKWRLIVSLSAYLNGNPKDYIVFFFLTH